MNRNFPFITMYRHWVKYKTVLSITSINTQSYHLPPFSLFTLLNYMHLLNTCIVHTQAYNNLSFNGCYLVSKNLRRHHYLLVKVPRRNSFLCHVEYVILANHI